MAALLEIMTQHTARIKRLPVGLIDPNPAQPRRVFDMKAIAGLAASIKENGLLSPVSVRRCGDRYQLIAGERRLLAFRLLGEERIPAIIEEMSDQKSAALALVENLQRRDLNFLEEAKAISALVRAQGLTQQQAAEQLGLSQPAVANKLRLLRLPEAQTERLIKAELTERHARALLPLSEEESLEAAVTRVIKERLNVSQTEKLVNAMLLPKTPPRRGGRLLILKDLRLFTGAISRAVDVMRQAGIDAVSSKTENDEVITYTVTIPKKAVSVRLPERSQTPPLAAGALMINLPG